MINHVLTLIYYRFTNSVKSENLSHNFLNCFTRLSLIVVENVLLKECVISIHMCAVKKSVPIYNLIPKALSNVVRVVIFIILYVVLVRGYVLLFWGIGNSYCSRCVVLNLNFAVEKCCLESTKLFVEVNKNICATYLYQTFVSCYCKDNVLFVYVSKHLLAQNFIHGFPLFSHHTLFVEIDKVYFN